MRHGCAATPSTVQVTLSPASSGSDSANPTEPAPNTVRAWASRKATVMAGGAVTPLDEDPPHAVSVARTKEAASHAVRWCVPSALGCRHVGHHTVRRLIGAVTGAR